MGQFLGHHVGDRVLGLDQDNLEKVEYCYQGLITTDVYGSNM